MAIGPSIIAIAMIMHTIATSICLFLRMKFLILSSDWNG